MAIRRPSTYDKKPKSLTDWKKLCARLEKERDQLSRNLAKLQAECEQYRKALGTLMREEIDFDKQKLLAQVGKGKALDEFIAELEAQGHR